RGSRRPVACGSGRGRGRPAKAACTGCRLAGGRLPERGRAVGGAGPRHRDSRRRAPGRVRRAVDPGRGTAARNARRAREADGLKMTEINETEPKKSLSLSRPGRLELKKTVDAGSVPQ